MSDIVEQDEGLLEFFYLAPVGLIQTTSDGTIEMCNPLSAQLLMPIAIDGRLDNLFDVLAPHAPELREVVGQFAHATGVICQAFRFPVPAIGRPGRTLLYSLHVTRIDHDRLMAIVSDVTLEAERERVETDRRLHDAARIDVLTAMPNRTAVRELIDRTIAAPRAPDNHCALLMIGGQRFQQIAEAFGESVRDELLHVMALRLNAVLRPGDCVGCADEMEQIAARVGGDEFCLFLQRLSDPVDALSVTQRVLDTLAEPYAIGAVQLHCTVRGGLVRLTGDEVSADAVMRDAAIALGEARSSGAARWVLFDADMRSRAIRRGSLEVELRHALERDELFVVYQPVIELQGDDECVAGVEALVRWNHPTRGIVSPVEFIGLAEETGLIEPLGRLVLTVACREFVRWTERIGNRAPPLLAVNVSRQQLGDPTLIDTVREILSSTGMLAGSLQLEVTESLAAQDDGVQRQLHALKRLGIRLALDDFGTGYSSLSSLHLLPVDTVKIDRSFVTLLESSPHHRVLIEATIKVAKSLGMTTVAEGIETRGQASTICELGCDKAQGYLYSRPLGAKALVEWLERR